MGATYEIWLEDDTGSRIILLDHFFSLSFSHSYAGHGAFQVDVVYDEIKAKINPIFQPDWRVSCWRSPATGIPMRRERTYMLREPRIYTRQSDNMTVLEYIGRDGMDLLSRRVVPQAETSSYASKTAPIDDMMKAIVSEQMLYGSAVDYNTRAWPNGEFSVDGNTSLGPSTTKTFKDRNVLDVLKELRDESFSRNKINSTRKIYFDVVESQIPGTTRFGWAFRTFADVRGADRTGNLEFSIENENLRTPTYSKSYLDEINAVYVKNNSATLLVTDPVRMTASRWNRMEGIRFGYFDSGSGLSSIGYDELGKNIPVEEIDAIFLNVPENGSSPRSLYGVDWDFGDLLRVSYAGMQFEVDVKIVYIAVDEHGVETITGRNKVN